MTKAVDNAVSTAYNHISDKVSEIGKEVGNTVGDVLETTVNGVKTFGRGVAKIARRVGGALIKIAKHLWDNITKEIKEIFDDMTGFLDEINLFRTVKKAMDEFFKVTETCAFMMSFFATAGTIMTSYGFNWLHVKAAYGLTTRNFWKGQAWLLKWIFTGGPVVSFLNRHGGPDFHKASATCDAFTGTVGLGGKIMTYFPFPKVSAAGYFIIAKAAWSKRICFALSLTKKLHGTYLKIKEWVEKFGIDLPQLDKRPEFYDDKIGIIAFGLALPICKELRPAYHAFKRQSHHLANIIAPEQPKGLPSEARSNHI